MKRKRTPKCSCVCRDGSPCLRGVTDGSNPPVCHVHRTQQAGQPQPGYSAPPANPEDVLQKLLSDQNPRIRLRAAESWLAQKEKQKAADPDDRQKSREALYGELLNDPVFAEAGHIMGDFQERYWRAHPDERPDDRWRPGGPWSNYFRARLDLWLNDDGSPAASAAPSQPSVNEDPDDQPVGEETVAEELDRLEKYRAEICPDDPELYPGRTREEKLALITKSRREEEAEEIARLEFRALDLSDEQLDAIIADDAHPDRFHAMELQHDRIRHHRSDV